MWDQCTEKRDLAIIDLLYSTGIRVGELINLNICNLELEQREFFTLDAPYDRLKISGVDIL